MSGRTITYLSDVALITCIVQRGSGDDIVSSASRWRSGSHYLLREGRRDA